MYHSISEEQGGAEDSYFATTTSPARFAEQMTFLKENGYRTVRLSDAVRRLAHAQPSEAREVAITFDDGFEDFYIHAAPVMQALGFQATMFVPTSFIGASTRKFKSKSCLSWSQVRELHAAGMSFGSHTASHPQLHEVSEAQLESEVRDSKKALEDNLGTEADSFCYPYAFPEEDRKFVANLREVLQQAGYKQGVCTTVGIARAGDEPFFLPRLPVSTRDNSRFLSAKLEGGYDWLHNLQITKKYLKRVLK